MKGNPGACVPRTKASIVAFTRQEHAQGNPKRRMNHPEINQCNQLGKKKTTTQTRSTSPEKRTADMTSSRRRHHTNDTIIGRLLIDPYTKSPLSENEQLPSRKSLMHVLVGLPSLPVLPIDIEVAHISNIL